MVTSYDLADLYSIESSQAAQALQYIDEGGVTFLAVSGKLGSGKDTTAPILLDRFGAIQRQHEFFARPLKDEVTQVIELIAASETATEAVVTVSAVMKAPVNLVDVIVGYLYDDVKSGLVTNAYQRTPSIRSALQFWGTDVRRKQDDNYWVKKAMHSALPYLAEKLSVYVTDARFPNEMNAVLDTIGVVVRLDVSPEEQRRRIIARDGVPPKEEALRHISETALDDFEGVSARVLTDNKSIDEVVAEIWEQLHG